MAISGMGRRDSTSGQAAFAATPSLRVVEVTLHPFSVYSVRMINGQLIHLVAHIQGYPATNPPG